MERNKKGISLVALVITIVVMIILSGAVIITGISVPQDAQLAVFKSNIATMQDAVTMKILNNQIDNITSANKENLKWVGVVKDYDGSKEIDFSKGEVVGGELALPLSEELTSSVNIKVSELANYYITEEGIVYHKGITINGETHYNNNIVGKDYTMKQVIEEGVNLTQGSQVTISTAQELKDLATYTNAGKNTKGVTFKLTKDIDLNEGMTSAYNKTTGLVSVVANGVTYTIGTGVEYYVNNNNELQTITTVSTIGEIEDSNGIVVTEMPNLYEWVPIGKGSYQYGNGSPEIKVEPIAFEGIFDGQEYTINGLYMDKRNHEYSQSFIAYNKGVVKNVVIDNSFIIAASQRISFIVSENHGLVYNCVNKGNLVNFGANFSHNAGMIGDNEGVIRQCSNHGNIFASTGCSGICGRSLANSMIDSCSNYGIVEACATTYSPRASGIVSEIAKGGTVVNCFNMGNTKSAGIVGASLAGQVINCFNAGTIATTSCYTVGGIVAQGTENIKNCYNIGKIINTNGTYTGGIIGYNAITGGLGANIENCYNLGTVTSSKYYVGEIAGRFQLGNQNCHVYNYYNIDNKYFGGVDSTVVKTNPGTIDSSQKLTPGITINGETYTTLLSALNAWVDANKSTYPELKNWVKGKDGYPVLQ